MDILSSSVIKQHSINNGSSSGSYYLRELILISSFSVSAHIIADQNSLAA
jgi:hypothetical protein